MTDDLREQLLGMTARAFDEASVFRPNDRPPYVDFSAKVKVEPMRKHWQSNDGREGDLPIVRLFFSDLLVHKLGTGRDPFYETEDTYDVIIPKPQAMKYSEMGKIIASVRELTGNSDATIFDIDNKIVHFVEQSKAAPRLRATDKPQVVTRPNGETVTAYPGEVRLNNNGYRQPDEFWFRVVNIEGDNGTNVSPPAAITLDDMPNEDILGFATGLSQSQFYAEVAKQAFCKPMSPQQMTYLISGWLSDAQAKGLLSTVDGVFVVNN